MKDDNGGGAYRRRFLQGVGVTGISGVVAGCLGGDDDPDDEPTDDTADDADDDDGGPFFEVSNLDPEEAAVAQGDSIDISAIVTNTGDEDGEQDVEVRVDGEILDTESSTLASGDSETVAFEDLDTADVEPGEHTYGVYSDDDESTGTLTVEEPEPAFFEVSEVEPGDVSVPQGETVAVDATIQNTGDVEDTQTVALEFEGDEIASESVTLAGGGSEAVDLGEHETEEIEPGEYSYTVSTDDDEATYSLTVEEPPLLSVPYGLNTGGHLEEEEPQSEEPVVIDGAEFVPVSSAEEVDALNNVHVLGDDPGEDWFEPPAMRGGETGGEIEGTEHDALYQTELFGYNLGFEFEIDNGTYDVILHNAEIFHDEEGARVFDVSVQGETVAEELDMVAEVGDHAAHTITVEEVEVTDETLTIETETHEDFSKFAGIEIRWGGDVIANGLEAYFPLDDDDPVNQVTGESAEIVGDPTPGVEGVVGDAWEFDIAGEVGPVEDALVSEPLDINGEGATVGAWMNATDFEEWARGPFMVGGSPEDTPEDGWNIEWDQNDSALLPQLWENGNTGAGGGDPIDVDLETWYFVVGVVEGGDFRLHVFDEDGELEDSPQPWVDGDRSQSDAEPLIMMAGDGRETEGRLDEVWAYSRAFSEAEVEQLYTQASEGADL